MLELARNLAGWVRKTVDVAVRNLAAQDVIALEFHTYLFIRVSISPESPDAEVARVGSPLSFWSSPQVRSRSGKKGSAS